MACLEGLLSLSYLPGTPPRLHPSLSMNCPTLPSVLRSETPGWATQMGWLVRISAYPLFLFVVLFGLVELGQNCILPHLNVLQDGVLLLYLEAGREQLVQEGGLIGVRQDVPEIGVLRIAAKFFLINFLLVRSHIHLVMILPASLHFLFLVLMNLLVVYIQIGPILILTA